MNGESRSSSPAAAIVARMSANSPRATGVVAMSAVACADRVGEETEGFAAVGRRGREAVRAGQDRLECGQVQGEEDVLDDGSRVGA